MASSYTSNLNLEKPGLGEQSGEWGTTVNDNMDLIDAALSIKDEDDMSSNSATHLATQQSIKAYVDSTSGAPAADNIIAGDSAVNLTTTAGNITIDAQEDNSDIILKGTDGGADTTFLTIDGSDAGTASFNHDIKLASDSAKIDFGADGDITLQHTADDGLILKNNNTGDDSDVRLLMRTAETDIQANDILGRIQFQAINEGTGTDAILVAAEVAAVSEGDFSSSSNATKLSFKTGASEAATEKMSLSSGGNLTLSGNIIIPNDGNIGSVGDTDAIAISSAGLVTVSQDITVGDDINMTSDSAKIVFGVDGDVTLQHTADNGLILKNNNTGDGSDVRLLMRTGETAIEADDVVGLIQFQAPDDSDGDPDGHTVCASVSAVAEGNFTASSNATKLAFKTGASEAATEKMSLSSGGNLTLPTDGAAVNFGANSDVTLTHEHDVGLILSAGANHTHLTISSTEDGANAGPRLSLQRESSSPADGDDLGMIYFKGKNDADEETQYARIYAEAVDVTDGTEDARLRLQVRRNGTQTSAITIDDEVAVTGAASFDTMPSTPNPGFRAYRASNFTLSHATWTKVSLDTKNWDVGGYFDNSTNYRFTPLVQGYYQVNAGLQDASNNDVYDIIMNLYYNGSTAKQSRLRIKGATSTRDFYTSTVKDSDIIYFDGVDDYLEMYAYIARGGSGGCTLLGGSPRIFMSAMLLSRTG